MMAGLTLSKISSPSISVLIRRMKSPIDPKTLPTGLKMAGLKGLKREKTKPIRQVDKRVI